MSQGVVIPIKNQGQCGSCWAFSTTDALEALSKIADGSLQSFSEQQFVDCSEKYGNLGAAMNYVRAMESFKDRTVESAGSSENIFLTVNL